MITSRQIEAFRAVMELGTITMAAERLRISQPAVSKIIAGLEWEIGYPLFERIKGRLAPTGEARLLAVEADRMYYGLDGNNPACRAGSIAPCGEPGFRPCLVWRDYGS